MPNDDELERRMRERAFLIWIDEGEPEGRDKEHWEMARTAVEEEDKQRADKEKFGLRPPPGSSFSP